MSSNGIVSTIVAGVVAGLIVEACKDDFQATRAVRDVAPNVVVLRADAPARGNEFVAARDRRNAAPRDADPAPEPPPPPPAAAAPAQEVTGPDPVLEAFQRGVPAAAQAMLASGTTFRVRARGRVCTHTHRDGAAFTAVLTEPVVGSGGGELPAGAAVHFTVRAHGDGDVQEWVLEPQSVSVDGETRELRASASRYPMRRTSRARDQVIGATVGVVVGVAGAQATGRSDAETVAAGVAGGVAGGGVASGSQSCLAPPGNIDVTLDAPLFLPVR